MLFEISAIALSDVASGPEEDRGSTGQDVVTAVKI